MNKGFPGMVKSRSQVLRSGSRGQSLVEFTLLVPLLLILLLAIVDLARIYTTMLAVESGAREAADFGTSFGAGKWEAGVVTDTVAEMQKRACVATSDLPDYGDPDGQPSTGCSNPTFGYCLTVPGGTTCEPYDPAAGCDLIPPDQPPCTVTVTLTYDFHLIAPFNVEILGTRVGVPSTITFRRDSTFAMTDIDLSEPGP